VFPIKTADEVIKSGHTVIYELGHIKWDQSLPPFILSVILLLTLPFGFVLKKIFEIIGGGTTEVNLKVDENLPNYFKALEKDDKQWLLEEENHVREKYGMKVLCDETMH